MSDKPFITFFEPEYIPELNCWSVAGSFQVTARSAKKLTDENIKAPTESELSLMKCEVEDAIIEALASVVKGGFKRGVHIK